MMNIRLLIIYSISLIFGLCMILDNVVAEEMDEKSEVLKEEGGVELERLVVTGTKTERRLKDVPVRTKLITREDVEAKGADNFYDIMEGIPGVRVEEQCSYCNFSILRMMGMSSGQSLILIDGMPVYTGLAAVYGLEQIQSGTIERVEIVKGAGSALYGSEAIAGVVNIITKEPTAKSVYEASATYGSYNDGKFSLFASKRSGNLAGVISLQTSFGDGIDENDDGYSDRVETENFTGVTKLYWYNALDVVDRIVLFGSFLREFRKGGKMGLSNEGEETDPIITWDNPFAEAAENIHTARYEGGIGIRKGFAKKNEINIDYHYSHHKRNATNDAAQDEVFIALEALGEDLDAAWKLPMPFLAEEFIHVGEVKYTHPFDLAGSHLILVGTQFRRSDYDQEIGQFVSEYLSEAQKSELGFVGRKKTEKWANDVGVYLQEEYSPSPIEDLTIVAGVRYDYHESEEKFKDANVEDVTYDTDSVNPRGALKYSITDDIAFRASVGTGYRVPYHFDEELHLCSGSPKIAKPSDLDPEKSISYSVSADYIGHRHNFGVGFTRIDVKDKLSFEPTSKAGYDYEWRNMEDAYSNTIEAEAGIEIIEDLLQVDLSYAFMLAKYDKNHYEDFDEETWGGDAVGFANWSKYKGNGKYIPRVSEHSSSVIVNLTPGDFSFFVIGKYTGAIYIEYHKDDVYLTEIKKTKPFWVVDMRTSYQISDEGEIFAGVKNLNDYVQSGKDKRPDDAAFMWAPYTGREFYGGGKISF